MRTSESIVNLDRLKNKILSINPSNENYRIIQLSWVFYSAIQQSEMIRSEMDKNKSCQCQFCLGD